MKRVLVIVFLITVALTTRAQVVNQVIASAGGYSTNSGIAISWTLGETVIPTFISPDGNMILSHGFQQKLIVTAVKETIFEAFKVKVYPNPAAEILNIEFSTELTS